MASITSSANIRAAIERFDPVLQQAGADRALRFGRQLFAFADALDESHAVRATLANPNYPQDAKLGVVRRLLRGGEEEVIELVSGMTLARWPADDEFSDAVSRLGYECALVAAEQRGILEQVENEIFQFERLLVGSRELRIALGDPDYSAQRRVATATALLEGRVDAITLLLIQRAAGALRGRHIPETLRWLIAHCAERRHRLVAAVTAAAPLSDEQLTRTSTILERMYGRKVQLNVSVDPEMIGGMRVQIGSDVMDGTVAGRLAEVKRQLGA